MKNEHDEAKLTAYALGELSEAERAEVEAQLASDPAAGREVEEIRKVAGILTEELKAEPAPKLTSQQRKAVKAQAAKPQRKLRIWIPLSAAASILIVVAFLSTLSKSRELGHQVASLQDEKLALEKDRDVMQVTDAEKIADVTKAEQFKAKIGRLNQPIDALPQPSKPARVLAYKFASKLSERASAIVRQRGMRKSNVLYADGHVVGSGEWLERLPGDSNEAFRRRREEWNREAYDHIVDNPFRSVADHPLSTFSIDVDTASYANIRRLLNQGTLPPKGAVRIEEMINYFSYDYAGPKKGDKHPFAAHAAVAGCPWNARHRLVRVAIKGREIAPEKRPSSNFVFLLDVSGSMRPANKLPLVKRAMKMLVERLGENDRIAITVYAGAAGLVLDSTTCDERQKILSALERLRAGGSTAGAAGIKLAYQVAAKNFIKGGVNRVILCTDGDFNVGITNQSELVRMIEGKAKTGVFLSVLGFGMGNYQDSRLEKLADKGNGNYAYIDTIKEARKVLVTQMSGTLITIAKDVKIQIEFNPTRVAAYRLIGYENRILAKEDFKDDKKDAGEIGAGHTVTALYEVVPAGEKVETPAVAPLKYQTPARPTEAADSKEMLTLKLRYKRPDGDKSTLMEYPVADAGGRFDKASADFRFATAVASFGMILRDSKYKGTYTLDAVIELAQSSKGKDKEGYRAEFIQLVKTAKAIGKK